MELHYFPTSHWSRVISLVIAEKGLTPTRRLVDIRHHATFAPEYIRLNPRGVVPTLVDGARVVWDSLRIAEYLDERAGPPLYGPDPALRERVRELEEFPVMLFSYSVWTKGLKGERSADILAGKITLAREHAARYPALRQEYERKASFFERFRAEVYDERVVADALGRWGAYLEAMGETVRARPWLLGEDYSLADCIAVSTLYRLIDLGLLDAWSTTPGHPLRAYYDRLRARPSFAAVFTDDPLLATL